MSSQQSRAAIALLITMLIWGSSAVFIRSTAVTLGPENALAFRYLLMLIILVPFILWRGAWRIHREDWPRLLIVSIVGMAAFNVLLTAGFARIPAGIGTVITMSEPIMIALLAWVLLRERLSKGLWIGLAVSVGGALVLFWPSLMREVGSNIDGWGVGALLIASLAWAIYTVAGKPLLEKYNGFNITALTFVLSTPVYFPLATKPILPLFWELDARLWFEMFFLIVPNAFVATLLWNYGSKHLSGAVTGSFLYLIPVIAVACGALILGEPVTWNLVTGGLLIIAGVAVAQFGEAWWANRHNWKGYEQLP